MRCTNTSAQSNRENTVRSISRVTTARGSAAIIGAAAGVTGVVLTVTGISGPPPPPPAHSPSGQHAATARQAAAQPLRLISVSPASGSRHIDGARVITVTFNEPLPATAPLPRLSPAIAGSWQREGDTVVFRARTGFRARTHVTVTVPGTDGTRRSGYKSTFTTAAYSTLRLQQLLAQLGYLPVNWHPDLGAASTAGSAAAQLGAAYQPPPGTFSRQRGYPKELYSFWKQGSDNLLDKGAITGFEADHGMTPNGVASPGVWAALMRAADNGSRDTHGYSYAIASQGTPETLSIWHDGRHVLTSLANTGISIAPTPVGTFPVYLKLPYQVMQGTNPDGSHYADPVQWVSYFEGGSAVHYIGRGSYGSPQSLGCVELPYSAAHESYGYLPYGTLVTVTP